MPRPRLTGTDDRVALMYGGDYNPEQWSSATWREDAELMARARVNIVRLPVFGWSRIQADEGSYDLDWLDEVLELLMQRDIRVILATATASIPIWALRRYPDIVAVDADGTKFGPGSRQHYAPASPDYARLAKSLVGQLGRRYSDHPAVAMWNVNNEYGCHVHADYSTHAEAAFQRWLEQRYGSPAMLNDAWGTSFWSQRYASFDEVQPPRKAPYSINPGQALDFRRYTSDQLLSLFLMEKSELRQAGVTQPITTNFMGAFKPVNYWDWAEHVDVIADDSYPDPADVDSFRDSAFTRDLMRSLKPHVPWLLMEQATNAVNWRTFNAAKAPGQMAATSMQAIGRGADGVMFFQWRQSAAGSEKFHSAMLPHAGIETRTWREVVELGAELASMENLGDPDAGARVALMFDWESWWAVEAPDLPGQVDYVDVARRWHRAIHVRNIPIDFVSPRDEGLERYRVIIAPMLYLADDESIRRLDRFVAQGGLLVAGPLSDIVNENDRFLPDGFLTRLGTMVGARILEFDSFEGESGGRPVTFATVDGLRTARAHAITEHFSLEEDVEIIATVDSAITSSAPAVIARSHGAGRMLYLGTVLDERGVDIVVDQVQAECELESLGHAESDSIEISRRGEILTLVNHGPEPASVQLRGVTGETETDLPVVRLGPYEWSAVRILKSRSTETGSFDTEAGNSSDSGQLHANAHDGGGRS